MGTRRLDNRRHGPLHRSGVWLFLIVNWVEKEAKSVRSEPTAKKPKSAANATSAAGGGGGGGRGGGGGGGDGGGEWWWWWW